MTPSATGRSHARWWLWLPLLAASAWLAWEQPGLQSTTDDMLLVKPTTATTRPGGTLSPAARVSVQPAHSALKSRADLYPEESGRHMSRDLFASVDWTPPPPPAPTAPPAAPSAPPLPFTYVGKQWRDGLWTVFLSQGDATLIAQAGQTLAGEYRIDAVEPPLMTLTYLPLGQTQTLAIGETR